MHCKFVDSQNAAYLGVWWHIRLDTLLLTDTLNDTADLAGLVVHITWEWLPVIEH